MLTYIYTRTNLPTYLDSKTTDVIIPVSQILKTLSETIVACPTGVPPAGSAPGTKCLFPGSRPLAQRAYIGLPDQDSVNTYTAAKSAGQLWSEQRCLIEEDVNEAINLPCAAWMPRYTRGPMTSDVLNAQQQGLFVGFWTINDPATMDAFMTRAVPNGFLTNYLGLANQRFEEIGIVPPYTPYRVTSP